MAHRKSSLQKGIMPSLTPGICTGTPEVSSALGDTDKFLSSRGEQDAPLTTSPCEHPASRWKPDATKQFSLLESGS